MAAGTTTIAEAAERQRRLELKELLQKQYKWIDWKWDLVFWVTAIFVVAGAADITKQLFAGDWDFWTDWKDPQWWPVITAFATIIIPSALQYIQWAAWRFPTGATYTSVCFFLAAWVGRYFQWHVAESYPMNFVWPISTVCAAIILDWLLMKQGIVYIRSQTPEYLRLIERGALRSFLGETQYVSLAFGGTVAIAGYWIGQFIGRYLAVWPIRRYLKTL